MLIHAENNVRECGVGFIVDSTSSKPVTGYESVSNKVIALRLASSPMNVTIIQCYAPTSQYDEDDIEAFYENTSKLMKKHRQDRLIIYTDFNAKVGAGNKTNVNGIYGIERKKRKRRKTGRVLYRKQFDNWQHSV